MTYDLNLMKHIRVVSLQQVGYGKEVIVPLLIQKTNECIIRTTAIEEKIFASNTYSNRAVF